MNFLQNLRVPHPEQSYDAGKLQTFIDKVGPFLEYEIIFELNHVKDLREAGSQEGVRDQHVLDDVHQVFGVLPHPHLFKLHLQVHRGQWFVDGVDLY